MVEIGGPGSLTKPGSPEYIIYLWYFKTLIKSGDLDCEPEGWQDIDGHTCLKVRIGQPRSRKAQKKMATRYWVDLARGGHPLKVEHFSDTHVSMRIEDIQLDQLPTADGKTVWLPVSGRISSFRSADGYQDSPTMRENCKVIDGSVRINKRLTDSVFSIKTGPLAVESASMKRARLDFEKIPIKPFPRTDPEGVQQDLDRRLAEADRQARRLEASSAARETWGWVPLVQLGFGVIGLLMIGSALAWKLRSR